MRPNSEHKQTLEPDFLLLAYSNGLFPMASGSDRSIEWFFPDPRAIIPIDQFRVSRSLRQTIRKKKFVIRTDTAFERVVRACADRPETWISEEIVRVYTQLFHDGFAHSVECWQQESLVGGLYGVAIRGAFFGESMFSLATDASKVALTYLVERLRETGFLLLDTQFMTEHLRRFGATEIPRFQYLELLSKALEIDVRFRA